MAKSMNLSGLKVSHLMSSNVIVVNEDDSVSFVIKIFDRCSISGAPVINKLGEYVGVISKTDLFSRCLLDFLQEHGDLDRLQIKQIMNPTPPLSVEENMSVERAAELMLQNHIHRVFVNYKDKIVGVVSSYDILKVVASMEDTPSSTLSLIESEKEQRFLNIRAQLQKKAIKTQKS